MRDRLIKLLTTDVSCDKSDGCSHCEYNYCDDKCNEHYGGLIADYLLENGVVVPPCKVGSDIYYIGIRNGIIQEMQVNYGTFGKNGLKMSAVCKDGSEFCSVVCAREKTCGLDFCKENIGVTVFLAREEAEKALAERSKNEKHLCQRTSDR